MQTGSGECDGISENYCFGACESKEDPLTYNARVREAIDSLQSQPSFAIIEKGLEEAQRSCILVVDGRFYGMGYIPSEMEIPDPESLKELLTPYKENNYILNMLSGYASRFPEKTVYFQPLSLPINQ